MSAALSFHHAKRGSAAVVMQVLLNRLEEDDELRVKVQAELAIQ